MTDYNQSSDRYGDRDFVTGTTGAILANTTGTFGRTLASSTTYFVPLGGQDSPVPALTMLNHAGVKWDSLIVMTITIETCPFPATIGARQGATDISDFDTTKGNWIQENPTSGVYISVTSSDGTTGGATVTNASVAVAGGTAGGCSIHLGNLGARRCRLKFVVTTTGGVVRVGTNGKVAA